MLRGKLLLESLVCSAGSGARELLSVYLDQTLLDATPSSMFALFKKVKVVLLSIRSTFKLH